MSRRRNRGPALLGVFLVGSALAQGVGLLAYDSLKPIPLRPPALLTISFEGEGGGRAVIRSLGRAWGRPCISKHIPEWFENGYCSQSLIADIECTSDDDCRYQYPRGHRVVVEVDADEGSFLDGWSSQCMPGESFSQCTMILAGGAEQLVVYFEPVPQDVEVETVAVDDPEQADIELPDTELEALLLDAPVPVPEPEAIAMLPPAEPEPETLPVEPPPIPETEPPPPVIPKPQPEPEPPAPAPAPENKPPPVKMKSVEVADDESVVKQAPADAQFVSDKNRDVVEQTHARDTNLEKEQTGKGAYSEKSDLNSSEVGAQEAEIAQLEDVEASSLDADDEQETTHDGKDKVAMGIKVGEEGHDGARGDSGDDGDGSQSGALSMRGIEGRGQLGGIPLPEKSDEVGSGGRKGRKGRKGRSGIKTDISFEDYERIVGVDKADEEMEIAKRTRSKKKGRFGKKIARVKSSLENFTPEIRPGNQTALKTRAEPFAVYVARMHRRIHELWGFGFLDELDGKSTGHEMNKWELMTKIEIVVNPDGTVDKTTIVQYSGVLTFDVAALDTVFTAEPFEAPPVEIRSPDGKVYLHWRFHRDWRQCGTFGVDKFIRSDKPKGSDGGNDEPGMFTNRRKHKRRQRTGARASEGSSESNAAAAARATANLPAPDDPGAEKAALAWMSGFEEGQVGEMSAASGTPFLSRGQIVANDMNSVAAVYRTVLVETSSRKVVEWRILSPAGYRKRFESLPRGAETGSSLFLVVKIKGEMFTLTLKPESDGTYKVVGFDR